MESPTVEAEGSAEPLDPFLYKVCLTSPKITKADLALDQFTSYMISYENNEFWVTLYGNQGRRLRLSLDNYRRSKYRRFNEHKNNSANTVLTQVTQYKVNFGLNTIQGLIEADKVIGPTLIAGNSSGAIGSHWQYPGSPADIPLPSPRYILTLCYTWRGNWMIKLNNDIDAILAEAKWNDLPGIEALTKLFLAKEPMLAMLALAKPDLALKLQKYNGKVEKILMERATRVESN